MPAPAPYPAWLVTGEVPPAEADRSAALAALVSGEASAMELPEQSTDPGKSFDARLASELAPVTHERRAASRGRPASVRFGSTRVEGNLPPEVVQRIVRQNFGRLRACYEAALRIHPTLRGRVVVDFTIGTRGEVTRVAAGGDLPHQPTITCVSRAFHGLTFPQPEGGIVKVSYPIVLAPGG